MLNFAGNISRLLLGLAAVTSFTAFAVQSGQAQTAGTTFFVTSNGIGNGANLGGLAGADNHCQTLAQAAGAGAKPGTLIFRPKLPMVSPP